MAIIGGGVRAAALLSLLAAAPALASQESLIPVVNRAEKTLEFDWPMLRIGTGEYAEGPTGVTVFHFARKVLGAVDVRGGGPGTVNTDYLRLGYEVPELDAVVFSGGSWYGLESTTAVATALKDDGIRDGNWDNLALAVGAIIYDFGTRRLNEIHPDKRLAQAAYRAARPGIFPLGAHGAGRFARSGGLFGCNAYSGQGGAFRQSGDLKIAAFTVVNALGVVTTREGRVAACYPDSTWSKDLRTSELLARYADAASNADARNTTISLVVTNQKLGFAELQRLAIQVHTSMARALQPFATEFDGDVLYAVSTAELDRTAGRPVMPLVDLGVIASELMWDAVLSSVPPQPAAPTRNDRITLEAKALRSFVGEYVFGPLASLRVTAQATTLYAQAIGSRDVYAIGRDRPVELHAVSPRAFTVAGRYPLVLSFDGSGRLVINPGPWEQIGRRRQ